MSRDVASDDRRPTPSQRETSHPKHSKELEIMEFLAD